MVHILDIFLFLFRYFLLESAYSRVFSLACLFFYFSQQLYRYWFFFFAILCRICRRLPPGVMCVVPVDNVWYSNCYLQELTPVLKKYVLHYKGLLKYWRSKGIIVTLPCDSLLISEYLSYLQDAKNSYAVLSLAFFLL